MKTTEKKWLAKCLRICGALLVMGGFAADAGAKVTLTQTSTFKTFAEEIFGEGSGNMVLTTETQNKPNVLPATVILTADKPIAKGTVADFTFKLSNNAVFGGNIPPSNVRPSVGSGFQIQTSKLSGGVSGANSVKFRVEAMEAAAAGDTISFTIPSIIDTTGTLGQAGNTISVDTSLEMVSSAGIEQSFNEFVVVPAGGGVIDRSANAIQLKISPSPASIAVDGGAVKFVTGTDAAIGNVRLAVLNPSAVIENGLTPLIDFITTTPGNNIVLNLDGMFGAATGSGYMYLDMDRSGNYNSGDIRGTVTATSAEFTIPYNRIKDIRNDVLPGTPVGIRMKVNGTTVIDAHTPMLTGDIQFSRARYDDEGEKVSGTLGPITMAGGSTAEIDFLLTPGGLHKNYVRITNKSNSSGSAYFQLINDAGQSSPMFSINSIPKDYMGNAVPASIPAQGSSQLLDMDDIYTAAMSSGSFSYGCDGCKLRMRVVAAFSDLAVNVFSTDPEGKNINMMPPSGFVSPRQ